MKAVQAEPSAVDECKLCVGGHNTSNKMPEKRKRKPVINTVKAPECKKATSKEGLAEANAAPATNWT
jgi:hypothetical protein